MKIIEQRLRDTIGLDPASMGPAFLERVVRSRLKSLGLRDLEEYQELLAASEAEWEALVESVVVTETWFFREPEALAALVHLVLGEWAPGHRTGPVRLLSVPCATGEEPYSLAIALLEGGLPLERFRIDAVDVSAHAVARARRAFYRRNSFRGRALGFRDRYFEAARGGFALKPAICNSVHFSQGNLLADGFRAGYPRYDFIFCRNLLVYFDRPTQQKTLEKLDGLLRPGGVLFVGPAEQPLALDYGFISAQIPRSFACRKANSAVPAEVRSSRLFKPCDPFPASDSHDDEPFDDAPGLGVWESPAAFPEPLTLPAAPPPMSKGRGLGDGDPGPPPLRSMPKPAGAARGNLEMAYRLADAGDFPQAVELCEGHLRRHGQSAEAYYLLGLLHEATHDARALDDYRRAVYLAPDHYEALVQMAWLARRNGEVARARALASRARRLKERR